MNTIDKNDIPLSNDIIKTHNRKPYKYPEGCRAHYKNIEYIKNYYITTNKKITCPLCNLETDTQHLKQHQKTNRCKRLSCQISVSDIQTTPI